tara:strand:+ start:678 stop:1652 length:975 start_codon:yes stop_codon:yes gene_type:complete
VNKKATKSFPKIILIEPIWGNNTYPYYFGTIKEVFNSGVNFSIIKEKITSVKDIKKIGLKDEDVIIFGYGWLGSEYFHKIEGIEDLKNLKLCFFHKPFNNYMKKVKFVRESNFSLLLSSTPKTRKFNKDTNIKTILFPYGCDNRIFGLYPQKNKKFDIGFSGALHNSIHYKGVEFASQDLRFRAQEKISKYFAGKKFLNGSDNIWYRIKSTKSYARVLQKSKIWLSTTGPMNDMSSRYFEVAGSSSISLTNNIPEEYGSIFKDKKNVIVFKNDCSNILDKLANAIEDSKNLKEMALFARNEVMKNHTYIKRSEELITLIEKLKS